MPPWATPDRLAIYSDKTMANGGHSLASARAPTRNNADQPDDDRNPADSNRSARDEGQVCANGPGRPEDRLAGRYRPDHPEDGLARRCGPDRPKAGLARPSGLD